MLSSSKVHYRREKEAVDLYGSRREGKELTFGLTFETTSRRIFGYVGLKKRIKRRGLANCSCFSSLHCSSQNSHFPLLSSPLPPSLNTSTFQSSQGQELHLTLLTSNWIYTRSTPFTLLLSSPLFPHSTT